MTTAARRIAVVLLIILTACTNGPGPAKQAASNAIPRGGTLRLVHVVAFAYVPGGPPAVDPDPTTLDPALSSDYAAGELFRCCVARSLLSYTGQPTDKGGADLRPDLASRMPDISADGLTWTFHIRPGIHYAPPLQQTEIVAPDFIRSFQRASRLTPVPLGPFFSVIRGYDEFAAGKTSSIGGLETPDAHTLVVRLVQPQGSLGYRLSLGGGITTTPLPALPGNPTAAFGVATGHDQGYGAFFVSSGPYMVEGSEKLDFSLPPTQQRPVSGLVPGHSLTLVRNPSWRAASDPLRPAYADRIEISFSGATREDAAAKVDRGEADLLLWQRGASPDQVRAYKADPRRGRVEVQSVNGVEYLTMNLAAPPFDDLHVRRAVAYAIDRQALLGAYVGPLSGSLTGHIATDGVEDNALLTFDPYRTKDSAARIAAARREMALSPYDADHDGVCDVAACRQISAISRSSRPPATTEVITRSLADIGITIDVQPLGPQAFFSQLGNPSTKTAIAFMWGFFADYLNGDDWFPTMFGSASAGLGANSISANFSLVGATPDQLRKLGYSVTSVPNVDDRIAQCVPLVGAAQTRCWTALDVYLMDNVVPVVPLISVSAPQIIPSRVLSYSYDQSNMLPALDRIAVKH